MGRIFIKIKNLLWRAALKFFVNPNKIVTVHGNRMYLDDKDSLLLLIRKNFEPDHVKLIKENVAEGDVVCDIGAHIGYYTLILARAVGPRGKVFAFEPNPKNFKILKKNVETNGYKNVILEQKAVSNKNEEIKLFFSKTNSGDGRAYMPLEEKDRRGFVNVTSVKLDDYFKDKNIYPSFFKIDVQGFEPFVLEGMKQILKKDLKMTLEFAPKFLESAQCNPHNLFELLNINKFWIFNIDKNEEVDDAKGLTDYYKKIDYFTTLFVKK